MDRLSLLEKAVKELRRKGTSEALQPNYLTIDPVTGLVTATFSGIVVGSVVLPEAPSPAIQSGSAVEWTADGSPGGALREWIQGSRSGTIHQETIGAAYTGNNQTTLSAEVDEGGTAGSAAIIASLADASGTNQTGVTFLDSLGRSNFVQVPGDGGGKLHTQLLWGGITAGGAMVGTSSGGFTITKGAAGVYTINWDQAFTDAGYGLSLVTGSNSEAYYTAKAPGSVQVNTQTLAGVATNEPWSFMAIGVY